MGWMEDIDEHRRLVKYYMSDFADMTKWESAVSWYDINVVDLNLYRLAQYCVANAPRIDTPDMREETIKKFGMDVCEIIAQTSTDEFLSLSDLLETRAEMHDLSKFAPPEREVFEVFTPKLKTLVYNSPEYKQALEDMGEGLDHHYQFNSHHPQYHLGGVAGMSLLDLIEMFCDWVAACDQKQVELNIAQNVERFGITPGIATLLTNTRDYLRRWHMEQGCPSYF